MSLADELLADLEDGDEQVDEFMVEDIDIKPDIKPNIKPIEDGMYSSWSHSPFLLSQISSFILLGVLLWNFYCGPDFSIYRSLDDQKLKILVCRELRNNTCL